MDVITPVSSQALTPDQFFALKGNANGTNDPRQIEKVANGLESVFFSMLCKEMRQTLEPGTLFGEDQGDVFGGLFDQFLGEHMAKGGPLGIAAMVRKQLAPKNTHEQHPQPHAAFPSRPMLGPTLY